MVIGDGAKGTDVRKFRYVGHDTSDLNLRFIIFIVFILHAECEGVHHRQEDERGHVRSLGHLSASELAASLLARASTRGVLRRVRRAATTSREAGFELDRTTLHQGECRILGP